ncbi:MAG: hypothetical protein Q4A78_10005 [Peptostreptococcaceae bacterium]|nr:hypothetical protein [Peptostreptococcaceae bacterium]
MKKRKKKARRKAGWVEIIKAISAIISLIGATIRLIKELFE